MLASLPPGAPRHSVTLCSTSGLGRISLRKCLDFGGVGSVAWKPHVASASNCERGDVSCGRRRNEAAALTCFDQSAPSARILCLKTHSNTGAPYVIAKLASLWIYRKALSRVR